MMQTYVGHGPLLEQVARIGEKRIELIDTIKFDIVMPPGIDPMDVRYPFGTPYKY